MDGVLQRHLSRLYGRALYERLCERKKQVRQERISVDGEIISYAPDDFNHVGMYVAADALKPDRNYFEIEIIDSGVSGSIAIGLVSAKHPLDQYPGWVCNSIGYHAEDGRLYRDADKGMEFGPKCDSGDRMGCGIIYDTPSQNNKRYAFVFFTKNGKAVGASVYGMPTSVVYPAVGLHSAGGEVRLTLGIKWLSDDDMLMCVDSNEEEWSRLHDIKLNGTVLEYAGRGKSIIDVGLAQAKYPLDTTHHYFEIEIMDPGENCYIAIGLARKDYPKYRHPGWNKGSIAYHADDGKIFVGSGVGDPFGPRCHKGDVMGCGIIFPRDFVCFYDCDASSENSSPLNADYDDLSNSLSESEDEEWWKEKENVETGVTVQVFFTRNGKTVGKKEVCIPKGGFYPTIGMLSSDEKVKVDLRPLTG
ncbi:SPRY domain-containing protein 3-like [Uloborus diversus]|uniref:SPRY domain-containing protein 3-like n=1 Tax=Uloborus diversus TaxID=327109 RepID=UPI00240A300C|nr:SPRY domain-containing protein 3-like [Uloborus diversus]